MMIDRIEGRPLELEAIYAIPLERATETGSPMPQVAMLHLIFSIHVRQQLATDPDLLAAVFV